MGEKATIGNFIAHKKGFAFKSKWYVDSGHLVVRVSDTTSDSIDIQSCNKIEEERAAEYLDYSLAQGDIVIMTVGSWPSNPDSVVGKVVRVPKIAEGALLNQNAVRVRAKENLDQTFLYYSLKNRDFSSYLIGVAQGSANQASITLDDIYAYETYIPPPTEQKAIAEVLSSLDDKIDLLHRQNQTLEQLAETLFRQWFVEEADEGWEEITFGELVQPQKGKNITKKEAIDGPYPVVAGGLEPSCYHNVSNTKAPVITISASGANAGFVRLYTSEVWSSDSSYIDYSITPYVYFSYMFLKLNQSILFDKQTGSAQPHIYPAQIMELDCWKYSNELISEFEDWCDPVFVKIKSNQNQIHTLTALRDTLLPKLMSGEVRIN